MALAPHSPTSHGERFLTNTGFSIEKLGRDELIKTLEDFKVRAVLAEQKAVAFETEMGKKDLQLSN